MKNVFSANVVGIGVGFSRNYLFSFFLLFLFSLLPMGGYTATHELVFIDTAVQDYEVLADAVRPGAEVHLLNPARDELEQMTRAITARHDISAIHILSHSRPGGMVLGGKVIDSVVLERNEALLKNVAHFAVLRVEAALPRPVPASVHLCCPKPIPIPNPLRAWRES